MVIRKQLVPFHHGFKQRPWFYASARNNIGLEALDPSTGLPELQRLGTQVAASASPNCAALP